MMTLLPPGWECGDGVYGCASDQDCQQGKNHCHCHLNNHRWHHSAAILKHTKTDTNTY